MEKKNESEISGLSSIPVQGIQNRTPVAHTVTNYDGNRNEYQV